MDEPLKRRVAESVTLPREAWPRLEDLHGDLQAVAELIGIGPALLLAQVFDGTPYIMRATLDPDKLYVFLRSISHGKEVETTLINTRGQHQVVDPGRGPFPSTSSYVPPTVPAGGVEEIEFDERATLIAYSWLK